MGVEVEGGLRTSSLGKALHERAVGIDFVFKKLELC